MALIYSQGGRLGNDQGGVTNPDQFALQGATYTGRRPCFVWFRGDLYIVGSYTRPIVRHGQSPGQWHLAGIRPPQLTLAVVPGAGSGGSSGAALCAITFLHKAGARVLAESNFSNVVDVGTLTGQGRVWSNVDNVSAEQRVTHVRGYCSMDGEDFRAVWEAPFGITGYVENVRTLQFTYAGPQDYSHNIPPSTRFAHEWGGRMWYGRSEQFPYRLWASAFGEPQYVMASSFRDTVDREPITAIWKGRNELLVFGIRSCQMARQFGNGENDWVLEKLDSDVGCLTQFGIAEIHNKLWFPAEDGIWIYDGSFKFLMKEMLPLWREDWKDNKAAFLDGFSMHDRVNKVYIYVTRRANLVEFENTDLDPATLAYCGYYGAYEPSMGGDQPHPEWTLDMRGRYDSCGFYDADGELLIGSCDGKIRKQDWTDGDDDGDTLQKELIIRTGHQLFGESGDDWESGKTLHQLWAYVQSENTEWRTYIRGGTDQSWQGMLPDNLLQGWRTTIAATAQTDVRRIRLWDGTQKTLSLQYIPETEHFMLPPKITGDGFTFEFRATAPVDFQYRGLGGLWGLGPCSTRGVARMTEMVVGLQAMDSADPLMALITEYPQIEVIFAGPFDLFSLATITYAFGAAAYPIQVTFTLTGTGGSAGFVYTETVSIPAPISPIRAVAGADPDPCPCPPGTSTPMTVTVPFTGTIVATATDANNVSATSETETISITPP